MKMPKEENVCHLVVNTIDEYLWHSWNQFDNSLKELFSFVLWIFKEGGVQDS